MKAKIIIDMPGYCDCCPCSDIHVCNLGWNLETDDNAPRDKYSLEDIDIFKERPDWCPLIPVEEESILKVLDDIDEIIRIGEGK